MDYLSEYRWYVITVIVLVSIVAVALYFKDVKKRSDDDEILEYQAYLESQRQQREAGGE